jgi:hypothetical protein
MLRMARSGRNSRGFSALSVACGAIQRPVWPQPRRMRIFGQHKIIYFGIDSTNPAVKSQIEALRDSGKIVHLYGTLLSNVPDYNGSQIQVDRIEVDR